MGTWLKLNEIKQIENFNPKDERRQALEGLKVWQRRSESSFDGIIDLIRKMQGKHIVICIHGFLANSSFQTGRKYYLWYSRFPIRSYCKYWNVVHVPCQENVRVLKTFKKALKFRKSKNTESFADFNGEIKCERFVSWLSDHICRASIIT